MDLTNYNENRVRAVVSVLLEIIHVLGDYRDHIVLIGGMVPRVLLGERGKEHVGSIDLDLLVDYRKIEEDAFSKIADLLSEAGYMPGGHPSQFERAVTIEGEDFVVPVDFLADESGGTGRSRRHQNAGGIKLRKLRAGDLATLDTVEVSLEGRLPDGATAEVRIPVVRASLFIVLKALVIGDRTRRKDCYDLYFVLRDQRAKIAQFGLELASYKDHPAVTEAVDVLRRNFGSVEDVGPGYASEIESARGGEDVEMIKRDAVELVRMLIEAFEKMEQ